MTENIQITREIAAKVLAIVDKGLSRGLGNAEPGKMCVEAAVCYALDLPHGDDPKCVSQALRSLKIRLNDADWSSNEARAKGLRRLALIQLGSASFLDELAFARRVAEMTIRKTVPAALRLAASTQKDAKHLAALTAAASRCEREGTKAAASAASYAASYASTSSYAVDASASSSSYAAASAASYAASAADAYAADASSSASSSCYAAATAVAHASYATSASAASYASYAAARDKQLWSFAEDVVQILIKMKVPGCQWLDLAEVEA